eukprot:s2259_g1.t1
MKVAVPRHELSSCSSTLKNCPDARAGEEHLVLLSVQVVVCLLLAVTSIPYLFFRLRTMILHLFLFSRAGELIQTKDLRFLSRRAAEGTSQRKENPTMAGRSKPQVRSKSWHDLQPQENAKDISEVGFHLRPSSARRPVEALLRRLAYPHAVDDLSSTGAELLRVVFRSCAWWRK